MDLTRAIRELHAEKARLEKIISSLEELLSGNAEPAAVTTKRRGRKFMNSQARKEVSERMKKYWAERRGEKAGNGSSGTPGSEPAPSAEPESYKSVGLAQ